MKEVTYESALNIDDVRRCTDCPNLGKKHVAAVGMNKSRVMVVFDHPITAEEVDHGSIASCEWGDLFTYACDSVGMCGVDRDSWYFTALAKCRPHGDGEVNDDNIKTCTSRWLMKEMMICQPDVVVCVGRRPWLVLSGAPEETEEGKSTFQHLAWKRQDNRVYIACWHPKIFLDMNNVAPFVRLGHVVMEHLQNG